MGFSVMEMLVVVFVFAILGVISTQILALSLRSSQKSASIGEVRANVNYAVDVMERLLRNASELDVLTCNSSSIQYINEQGESCYFECKDVGSESYIVSGCGTDPEVQLTSGKVRIDCSQVFSCTESPGVPPSVTITLAGEDAEFGVGTEGAGVTVQTQVQLRTY